VSKNLLIVESPAKAKTLRQYLGNEFQVLASMGHIKDLPEKELGVDLHKNFQPRYTIIKGKSKIIQQLKKAAAEAQAVYLAPDPDREGEAIAWHIAETIKIPPERLHRVLFNEITYSGVKYGIQHPRGIDINLVNAQQARRILDRIVGYQVSPYLWRTLYRGLSAGRVQSVAVRIICEREEEIDHFIPQEFWEIFAELQTARQETFTAKCIQFGGKKLTIANQNEAENHVANLRDATYSVAEITDKEISKTPPPPFTTSTLQQEATRRYLFSPERTMRIAQQLYEGVLIDGKPVGLITYMRTDSVRISNEAIQGVRELIQKNFGKDYLPSNARHFKTKKKNVQDAHEGIRPTHFDLAPPVISAQLTPEQRKIYTLIWNRFLACQMAAALYQQRIINITAGDYLLRATGNQLKFDGYLRAWRTEKEPIEEDKELASESPLPQQLTSGEKLTLLHLKPEQKFTEPPPRFTEGTLIKELDNLGIGRPSTYATIVSTIIQRKYIEKKQGHLFPTDLGKLVNKILIGGMPEIFNVNFTAQMEDALDEIANNHKEWHQVLQEFYQPFSQALNNMEAQRVSLKSNLQEKTTDTCPLCGAPLVIKWSRNGRFLACSAFPQCKYTRALGATQDTNLESKTCPECGGEMVLKEGRYGRFWACSNYPKCKTTAPYTLAVACPEPNCNGQIVQRRTKKGKTFFACSNYPECKFATWNEPVAKSCPQCGYALLVRKPKRDGNIVLSCPQCHAEYDEE
jgi:DNA topoisomerase-1